MYVEMLVAAIEMVYLSCISLQNKGKILLQLKQLFQNRFIQHDIELVTL